MMRKWFQFLSPKPSPPFLSISSGIDNQGYVPTHSDFLKLLIRNYDRVVMPTRNTQSQLDPEK